MKEKKHTKKHKILKILGITGIAFIVILMITYLIIRFYPSIGKLPDKKRKKEYEERTATISDRV